MVTSAAPGSRPGASARPARVLVVDDEPSLTELLTMALSYEGWEVRSAANGTQALQAVVEFAPDAVLLDRMLPDLDGVEVLRRLRLDSPDVPVLFLTARDSTEDREAGMLAGADGYLTKPFSLEAVVNRLQSLLDVPAAPTLTVGDLELSADRRTVTRAGTPITLTATEFDVLHHLMRHAGRVVPEQEIRAEVWGGGGGYMGRTNVVALCLTYLRRKIPLIEPIPPDGYRLG